MKFTNEMLEAAKTDMTAQMEIEAWFSWDRNEHGYGNPGTSFRNLPDGSTFRCDHNGSACSWTVLPKPYQIDRDAARNLLKGN